METVAKRPRRVFSAADKLRIVKEAERCLASRKRGDMEAMLRREGIYSSLLQSWRNKLGSHGAAGLAAEKPGRKPKLTEAERRNVELTKRNITETTSWACNDVGVSSNTCADGLTSDLAPVLNCNETTTVPTQTPCVASCVPSGGCGQGFVCVTGLVSLGNPPGATPICVRKGQAEIGATCTKNEDCLFGLCKNQICSRDCSADGACPSPFACASGVCL